MYLAEDGAINQNFQLLVYFYAMVFPRDMLLLPDDILIKIFQQCDVSSLYALERTCQRFNYIINSEESVWSCKSKTLLCTNMKSKEIKERSRPYLTCRKRCEVGKKWIEGLGSRRTIISYKRCMPRIKLEESYLYCNQENFIVAYNRDIHGNKSSIANRLYPHNGEISTFVINGEEIVTGARDGLLARWTKKNMICIHVSDAHAKEIKCVDALKTTIVSGSRDTYIKIWRAYPDNTILQKEVPIGIRVLSLSILPSCRKWITGLPGTENIHPLQLFDFEKDNPVSNLGETFRKGAGILDIYPECDSTFYSTGYDTTVKLWDIRTPKKHVSSWMDPYDNGMYCVISDRNVTIISGANRSGLVHIWDKRKPGQESIQIFDNHHSPAYSVTFDASHLFAAYDQFVVQHSFL